MKTMNTVLGQDLLSLVDGRQLGSVKDLVVGRDHERILGLVVEEPGLLTDGLVVAADDIHSFGKDAIVVSGSSALRQPDDLREVAAALEQDASLLGMKVYSDTGEQKGSVSDVYFDEASCRIVGFQVSDGALGDVAHGPRYLAVEEIERFGDEVIYVRPEVAASLAAQPGGLQQVTSELSQRASRVASDVGQGASEAADRAGQVASDLVRSGGVPSSGHGSAPPEGSELLGRRSGADVSAEDGSLVVAAGQRIEQRHLDWAREHDAVEALRAAVAVWDRAEQDRVVGDTVEGIRDAAGSIWDRFLATLADVTDASGKRMSEQQTKARLERINDAVGRPVTKVILDRDDEVILNLGDIITHQAIQRAYEAGTLDNLLDSVYRGDVSFERDEMKAPAAATASVEQASGGASVVSELEEQVTRTEQERQEAAERSAREAAESRARREEERAQRATQREEAARQATEEPTIPPDVPLAVQPDGRVEDGPVPDASGVAGGTWMERPDAPRVSPPPAASSPADSGGTWMERSDEAAVGQAPSAASAAATPAVPGSSFAGEVASDGSEDDARWPAEEPVPPHDGPAEGRPMDLPGADRDTSAERDMLGGEVRPVDDESGVPAREVELSDERDRLRRG